MRPVRPRAGPAPRRGEAPRGQDGQAALGAARLWCLAPTCPHGRIPAGAPHPRQASASTAGFHSSVTHICLPLGILLRPRNAPARDSPDLEPPAPAPKALCQLRSRTQRVNPPGEQAVTRRARLI